jgi:hypothetical protein
VPQEFGGSSKRGEKGIEQKLWKCLISIHSLLELSLSSEAANCADTRALPSIFMEPEGSLPCSQEPSTGPCSEPDHFSAYHPILSKVHFNIIHPPTSWREPGYRSLYSEWLWAGRPRYRSSSSGRGKNFHFSMSSRLALGPTQPPIQWVQGVLSLRVKWSMREADHSPPTSAVVKKTRV